MKIDLRDDEKTILAYIKDRLDGFETGSNEGPGDGPTVHQINFGYSSDQAGFFALVFDTRPDAETDGEWNSYLGDETMLELSHWSDVTDAMEDQTVTVVDHLGNSHEFVDYESDAPIEELIGEMLLKLMVDARDSKMFHSLPLGDPCHIAIENQLGAWGWPSYDDRGKPDTTA